MDKLYWYQILENKYIHLFETSDGVVLRGIEVNEGWKRIVEELLEKLEWIRTHNTFIKDPNSENYIPGPNHTIKIFQIKQKFGSLECYATVSDDPREIAERQVDEAIAYAQGQARLTCENCGRIGDVNGEVPKPTKGWISILCKTCKNDLKEAKEALIKENKGKLND